MTEIVAASLILTALVMALTLGLLAARARLVPKGALTVTVNDDRQIAAQRGDSLLSVLQGAGVTVPAGCGGRGTCGLCRVTATGPGAGSAQATEMGLLTPADRRAHLRLACQVNLRGPVRVTLPADLLAAETRTCAVVSNTMLAPLIRELVLAWPEGAAFHFRAGDFMQLTAPPYRLDFATLDLAPGFAQAWRVAGWDSLSARSDTTVSRAYSVASRPEDIAKGHVVFNIRLAVPPAGEEATTPPGIVSSYLFALRPGDRLGVSGPFGTFHAQPTGRDMVLVGGGVGMAPLRAIIHAQLAPGADRRRLSYFYGARSRADLFYHAEFDRLAAAHPQFTWQPTLSDPAPGDRWTGSTGFVHEALRAHLRGHPAPEDCEYYLCGPPMMIAAVKRTLDAFGVERESIFSDDFGI